MEEGKRLSLCMVTKDDEEFLSACFGELQGIADETIVVDIGSRDGTAALAQKLGARVYQMKWGDSCSEAKNLCLDHANGRWVLFLQPGEKIREEHVERILPLLDNPNVEGYLFHVNNPSEEHSVSSPVQSLRLFRNRGKYRFRYRSFERIPDEQLGALELAPVTVVHRDDSVLSRELDMRVPLLPTDLEEHPQDGYVQYLVGIELLNRRQYGESLPYLQTAYAGASFGELFAPHLLKCLGWAYLCLQRYEEALEILNEGVENFPFYSDFLILRAELHKQRERYGEAFQDLKDCIKIREKPDTCAPGPEIDSAVLFETLGELHERLCNDRRALRCYCRACEQDGADDSLLYSIGRLAQKTGLPEIMENLWAQSVRQKNPQRLMILTDILFQQREYPKILENLGCLESFLEKGEQTESIRLSCSLMLGDAVEDFSAIDRGSSFYSQLLLQRIENCWFRDDWPQAQRLLLEMDGVQEIDAPLKSLFRLIQELFTGRQTGTRTLGQPEAETAVQLHNHLLWLGRQEKASALLPLLLASADGEGVVSLAQEWARHDRFPMLRTIFGHISGEEQQVAFKRRIIEQLLSDGLLETAKRVMQLGKPQSIGDLEYVLWARFFTEKLGKWIRSLRGGMQENEKEEAFPASGRPDDALLRLYHSLNPGAEAGEGAAGEDDANLANGEIQNRIGDFYERQKKKEMALCAYLRALQWDFLNEYAQKKVKALFKEAPDGFRDFLEQTEWVPEGEWFCHREEFVYFVYGLIHFQSCLFEQSYAFFSQTAVGEKSYPAAFAYRVGILWLEGKEAEAGALLDQQGRTAELILLLDRICRSYVLCRLEEGRQKYPYSERISRERKEIRNRADNEKDAR